MLRESNIADILNLVRGGFLPSPFHPRESFTPPSSNTINSSEKPIDQSATQYKEQIVPGTGEVILVIDAPISQTTLPSHQKPGKKS